MKKVLCIILMLYLVTSGVGADFIFQETDPYCTISGTTHTSTPGEISDTSSWYIPTAYQGECDEGVNLTDEEKERVYEVMYNFFEKKGYIGPVYGVTGYGGGDTLNPQGQKYLREKFFPAITQYISKERKTSEPNIKNISLLNAAVQTIGYDYFLQKPRY